MIKMSDFKVIETQEELNRVIGERLAREKEKFADYEELKQKAEAYDAIQNRVNELETENSNLKQLMENHAGEIEGYKTQISDFEKTVEGYKSDQLKVNIALRNGLPLDFANRLQGQSEEELNADAEKFAGIFSKSKVVAPLKEVEPPVESSDAAYRSLANSIKYE